MHGHNVVVKAPPYIPITDKFDPFYSLSTEDLEYMRDWGVKIVRLGVMWESVEVQPEVYDFEYLTKVESLINRLGEYGIYTMVDNHQDLFSRKFCGNGAPVFYSPEVVEDHCPYTSLLAAYTRWVGHCTPFKDYNMEKDEEGIPLISECVKQDFFKLYTSPDIASVFEQFWDNAHGLQDKMFAFWKVVATKFKGNTNVIGYDIMNEPWTANMYKDITLFINTQKFDREKLFPFHVKADKAVREVDPDAIIFFSPC